MTGTKNLGVTNLLISVKWIEDEKQKPFSVACCQRTNLCAVNNIYEENSFCLNICSIDLRSVHWKEQKTFSGGNTSANCA